MQLVDLEPNLPQGGESAQQAPLLQHWLGEAWKQISSKNGLTVLSAMVLFFYLRGPAEPQLSGRLKVCG